MIEDKVKEIIKYHKELHKNVVEYAVVDDCVRKLKLSKEILAPIVNKLLNV